MYTVQFVGLVCFFRERGGRLALLPDGRDPGPGIDPHVGEIVVDRSAVVSTSGWNGTEAVENGSFVLPPCEILLEGADAGDTLDTSMHDDRLPQLRRIDPNFEIEPSRARTIAKVPIRRGKLSAFRVPSGEAVMSQLDIPHDGTITITVKPDDGTSARTVVLKEGTEIAITNMARGVYGRLDETLAERESHFKIYERLSVRPVSLKEPTVVSTIAETASRHPMFSRRRSPIGLFPGCSNTGCC